MAEKKVFSERHCKPCEGGVPPLSGEEAGRLLGQLDGWKMRNGRIVKVFEFKNYLRTMAFANAVAWVAIREGHHPELRVGYDRCEVSFTTHAAGGLTENDFICAAKVNELTD